MKLDSEFLYKIMKDRGITLSDVSSSTEITIDVLQKLFDGEDARGQYMIKLMRFFKCNSMVMFKNEPSTIVSTSSLSTRRVI